MASKLHLDLALTPDGWRRDIVVRIDHGIILGIEEPGDGTAQRVSGIVELESGRYEAGAGLVERSPVHFAVVFEALKNRRDFIYLIMAEEGVFANTEFIALPFHDIHGIVKHAFHQEITQLGHAHVGLRKVTQPNRQGADMIMVAVGNGDGVNFFILHGIKARQRISSFSFGMNAGVHQ